MAISYTAIVLDRASHEALKVLVPDGWDDSKTCHHCTLNMGSWKGDPSLLGTQVVMGVNGFVSDGKVCAVGVSIPSHFKTKAPPHVTVAVTDGGKPFLAGKLDFNSAEQPPGMPSQLTGVVKEVEEGDYSLVESRRLFALRKNNQSLRKSDVLKIRLSELRRVIREEVANNDPVTIIDNTDPAYIEKTLATRNPSGAIQAGSVFLSAQTVESLRNADWRPFDHPAIKSPAIAFTAPIPGRLGVVLSSELPGTLPVRFQLSHGGKGGKSGTAAEAIAAFDTSLGEVDSTTLIAGPDKQDPQKYVVWTFHPGDPSSQADEISIDSIKEKFPDLRATVADARSLGFNFIKRVDKLSESNLRLRRYIQAVVTEHITLFKDE